MLLSIIIPIYNVEEYLLECLDSVVRQINEECELILVNDGSTDNSFNIANEFMVNFKCKNITLVTKTNGGLSDARNKGIELAKGKYIGFLDSDDFVVPEYIPSILSVIKKNINIDIIEFDCFRFFNLKNINPNNTLDVANYEKNKPYFSSLYGVFKEASWFSCSRVFKAELFADIKFPVGRRFEDMATTPILYLKAKNIVSIRSGLLGYRYNPDGITNNLIISDISDISYCLKKWINWQNSYGNKDTKILLGISMLKLAIYVKWLNQSLDKNDFSLTKIIRKNIIKNTPFSSYVYSLKSIPYLFCPRLVYLTSLIYNKLK